MTCFDLDDTIAHGINKINTQWRESPKLQAVITEAIEQLVAAADAACVIPEKHDILTAVGDQLTNIGKILGWPRCHCICDDINLCIDDDDTYRGYLLARRYQYLRLFDVASLQSAAEHIWGENASVKTIGGAQVAVGPGRELTDDETLQVQLAFRVLPIAPGIQPYLETSVGPTWGFGAGWAGLCEGHWSCPVPIDPYGCE
jgi:hypothetical protein